MSRKEKAPKYIAAEGVDLEADLKKAVQENEAEFSKMEELCSKYNNALEDGQSLIRDITELINSIANRPKKLDEQVERIQAIKIDHLSIEQFKSEERKALIEGGVLAAAFGAIAGAYSAFAKNKNKGIIGCVIALIGFVFGALFTFGKKRKAKKQAIEAINKLYADTFSLRENQAKVQSKLDMLSFTHEKLQALFSECEKYRGLDRLCIFPMAEDRKKLSLLVTNTASFAKLLSNKV